VESFYSGGKGWDKVAQAKIKVEMMEVPIQSEIAQSNNPNFI
jgi:hypothetical protein